MDNKQLFKTYYSRLAKEGVIKALILGLVSGMAAGFIVSLITFFAFYNGLWITIGVLLVVTAALTPIFYFKIYRPTTHTIAKRVDSLGLEERLITMLELEKDQSYIAMRQREDAKEKLGGVSADRLRFRFVKIPFIVLAAVSTLAITMTVLSVVNVTNNAFGNAPPADPELVNVVYLAGEGGMVYGPDDQLIPFGSDAEMVVAVENEWYMFDKWSDDVTTPERMDLNIRENLVVTALFIPLTEGQQDVGAGGEPGEAGDGEKKPPETPPDDQEPPDVPPNPGDPNDPGGSGGEQNKAPNMVDDGKVWYGDIIDTQVQENMNQIADNKDLPDYMREMAEEYYKYINIGGGDGGGTGLPGGLPDIPGLT